MLLVSPVGRNVSITIKDVLSVPKLEYNLLSVQKLEMNGFCVTFENGLITRGNHTVAVAHRNNAELYELNFRRPVFANLSTKNEEYNLWHKRLGYLNFEDVKKLQSQTSGMKIDFSKISKDLCQVCIEGMQTGRPHNQQRRRATRPLQLVHSDIIGPVISPISHDSKRYILMFIDDYTHFTASCI